MHERIDSDEVVTRCKLLLGYLMTGILACDSQLLTINKTKYPPPRHGGGGEINKKCQEQRSEEIVEHEYVSCVRSL